MDCRIELFRKVVGGLETVGSKYEKHTTKILRDELGREEETIAKSC